MLWRKRRAGTAYALAYLAYSLTGLLGIFSVLSDPEGVDRNSYASVFIVILAFGQWQLIRALKGDLQRACRPPSPWRRAPRKARGLARSLRLHAAANSSIARARSKSFAVIPPASCVLSEKCTLV